MKGHSTGTLEPSSERSRSAAPVAWVWKALTDAEELTRWFPLKARVAPGVGGFVWMSWAEGEGQPAPIEVWEPERHLRTGPERGSRPRIATDFYLEERGGGAVLQVVSSGFGVDEESDELYAAWGRGWDFELRGLRHYMERHLGERRLVAVASAAYTCSDDEAWERLIGVAGWCDVDAQDTLKSGARYTVGASVGRAIEGIVELWQPPRQFSGTAESWNDGRLRLQVFAGTATRWLSTFGVDGAAVRSLSEAWQGSLDSLFPS